MNKIKVLLADDHTVVRQVMNKLHIHDVAGLTRYAIARGVIETTPQLAGSVCLK